MATIMQVMAALQAQVATATTGLTVGSSPVTVQSAIGWPPLKTLQAIPGGGPQIIGIYDRKIGKDATRWTPFSFNQVTVAATLTTAVSLRNMPPSGSSQITLGATVGVGDAVSAVFKNHALQPNVMAAVVAIGIAGDTPSTMATKLANLINADTTISTWASALASGPVVTVTNLTSAVLTMDSYAGNGGSQTTEIGRREREIQVMCWTQTADIREAIVGPIATIIAADEADYGLTLPDGAYVRLFYRNDFDIEDETLSDVYRHDFHVCVDYPVNTQDLLYAVLAPIQNFG